MCLFRKAAKRIFCCLPAADQLEGVRAAAEAVEAWRCFYGHPTIEQQQHMLLRFRQPNVSAPRHISSAQTR